MENQTNDNPPSPKASNFAIHRRQGYGGQEATSDKTADGPQSVNLDKSGPKDPKQTKKTVGVLLFEAGIEFALLIAAPLVAGILAGQWLDAKTNHGFFVVIGILLGIGVSCIAIYKRIKDYKSFLK